MQIIFDELNENFDVQLISDKFKVKTHHDLLVYCGLRTPQEQAKLYRKSRTTSQIKNKILNLNNNEFDFLGNIIEDVGPQYGELGKHLTNAAPGESWHNYSEAIDVVPVWNGKPVWEYKGNESLWDSLGEICLDLELIWGGNWPTFKDLTHIQLKIEPNPLNLFAPYIVKDIFKKFKFI